MLTLQYSWQSGDGKHGGVVIIGQSSRVQQTTVVYDRINRIVG